MWSGPKGSSVEDRITRQNDAKKALLERFKSAPKPGDSAYEEQQAKDREAQQQVGVAGTTTIARQYWSNKSTGLVNDVPGEADLSPNLWGTFVLE